MENMFLTPEELKILTSYDQPASQIRWLRENRFNFKVRGDGKPIVLKLHVNAEMGANEAPIRKRIEPNRQAYIESQKRANAHS